MKDDDRLNKCVGWIQYRNSKPMSTWHVGILLGVVLGVALAPQLASAHFRINDSVLSRHGEFEVGNGQSRTIVNGQSAAVYRICVRSYGQPRALRVTFDGKSDTVSPGSCGDFEGKRISVAPDSDAPGPDRDAATLKSAPILLGRYHRVPSS